MRRFWVKSLLWNRDQDTLRGSQLDACRAVALLHTRRWCPGHEAQQGACGISSTQGRVLLTLSLHFGQVSPQSKVLEGKCQFLELQIFSVDYFLSISNHFSLRAYCSSFCACSTTQAMSGEDVDVKLIKEWKEEKEQLWQLDGKMPV